MRWLAWLGRVLSPSRKCRGMEVTRSNFKQLLPQVEAAIDGSVFVSIDGEFTGINAYKGISPFDLPHERYEKLQESARQFLLVQFGLCTFHYDAKNDRYTNQAFNFYVWPKPHNRQAPDPRFLCQTSSIDFLISQGFDFNKLYKEGVSYLRPVEMAKLQASLRERQEQRRISNAASSDSQDVVVVPAEQEEFLEKVHGQITQFLTSDEQSLVLQKCNSFQRKLIYQTCKEKFKNVSLQPVTSSAGDRVIMVVKADEEEQRKISDQRDQEEVTNLDEALGFTSVIQKISSSKKLVVGHNMILDVAHTLNQFCGPLPEEYADFKAMAMEVFPKILDTKLMANTIPFKNEITNSSLEELMKTVSEKPYRLPEVAPKDPSCGYSLTSEKYHEAGYDAFVTGLCFIGMANRLGEICGKGNKSLNGRVMPDSQLLQPFVNKLYLMRIADIPYLNLAGEDLKPNREHVFHLQFPPEWKTSDLTHLFSPFGPVYVSWINDTSAFVSVTQKSDPSRVLDVLKCSSMYNITTYNRFKELEAEAKESLSALPANPVKASTQGASNPFGNSPQLSRSPCGLYMHTSSAAVLATGITPVMEKITPFGVAKKPMTGQQERKRRPVSPDQGKIKRPKSVGEDEEVIKNDQKMFDEPSWE